MCFWSCCGGLVIWREEVWVVIPVLLVVLVAAVVVAAVALVVGVR